MTTLHPELLDSLCSYLRFDIEIKELEKELDKIKEKIRESQELLGRCVSNISRVSGLGSSVRERFIRVGDVIFHLRLVPDCRGGGERLEVRVIKPEV